MPGTTLHIGIEHPDVLWLLGTGLVSFIVGLGVGTRFDRVRRWLGPRDADVPH